MTGRVVHCKREPFDVLIDRSTPYGNPFSHKTGTRARWSAVSREGSIALFGAWARYSLDPEAVEIRRRLPELRGKVLGCWCAPQPCHGEVLLAMLNAYPVGWR